jgi:hypothetical protein
MQDLAKLSDLARAEIDALEKEGIVVSASDVVLLSALGWAVESPETRRLLARGVPVQVGGVTLWPLSIYASEWFDRVGCHIGGQEAQTYALAYAMAHSYEGGEAFDLAPDEARKALIKWGRGLRCTAKALTLAISDVLRQDEQPEVPLRDGKSMSHGEFAAMLATRLPGGYEFWERRCAVGFVFAALHAMAQQNAADGKPIDSDPRLRAERALGLAVENTRRRSLGVPELGEDDGDET